MGLWVRPASFVCHDRRSKRRFSSNRWRRRASLLWRLRGWRGVVGYSGIQLRGRWGKRQGRGRMARAGLGRGQSFQRAPQALIHLIQVDVIQISGGQVEATWETLHFGLRGRRAWWGELRVIMI